MKFFIFFILLFSLLSPSYSSDLRNSEKLRKISFLLRGVPPSIEDFEKLSSLNKNDGNKFISKKIDDYLNSEDFFYKMSQRLDELFRVQINMHKVTDSDAYGYYQDVIKNGSLNHLFYDIVSKNLSWDALLKAKEYKIVKEVQSFSSSGIQDASFFEYNSQQNLREIVLKYFELNPEKEVYTYRPNSDSQPNIAGAITTNRFFTRYTNTRINKNRRRAAAIFRIFLCDSMTPVVMPSKEENKDLLNLSLSATNSDSNTNNPIIENSEKRHGTDSQCMSCHYKLDPMAQTFIGSGAYLNKTPSPGALTYKKENGSLINVPVSGLGELGDVITQQEEYLSCQVSHFWNWFVGENIPLSEQKKKELAEKFDSLNRKPKDFIKELLLSSDFSSPNKLDVNDIRFSNVKPIFQRCNSCHLNEVLAPKIDSYPFAKNSSYNEMIVKQILQAADLLEEKDTDSMPPQNAGWRLIGLERDLVKAWIKSGAKDDDGNSFIFDENLKTLSQKIVVSDSIEQSNNSEFGNTHRRYLNNFDLMDTLHLIFSNPESRDVCLYEHEYDKNTQLSFGFANTIDGSYLYTSPSSSYFEEVLECMDKYLTYHHQSSFYLHVLKSIPEDFENLKWSELSENNKMAFLDAAASAILGKEIISFNSNENSLLFRLKFNLDNHTDRGNKTIKDFIPLVAKSIILSSEFLTY